MLIHILRFRGVTLAALLLLMFSCGRSGPQLGNVSGTVTLDGKPFAGAVVTFVSTERNGTTSTGYTDRDGRYTLRYTFRKQGAMIGRHNVKIEYDPQESDDEGPVIRPAKGEKLRIPAKYREAGALTADVQPGHQRIDFALLSVEGP